MITIKNIFYKKVKKRIEYERGVTYTYVWVRRFKINKPAWVGKGNKVFDIKKGMWKEPYYFWIFEFIVYKVCIRGKTKIRYGLKLK